MSKDKDLERIKKGQGLKKSETTTTSQSGTTKEKRGSGVRSEHFSLNDKKKNRS